MLKLALACMADQIALSVMEWRVAVCLRISQNAFSNWCVILNLNNIVLVSFTGY